MKILVTGANGQLGNEMRILAKETNETYIFTDVTTPEGVETTLLDITDLEAVRQLVKEQGVQCIVNCAAYTNVDKAETDEVFCRTLNAQAPQNLAVVMKEVNGLLVHVSTDYVFGGDPYNIPCREEQQGTPTGVYGQTKLEGEENKKKEGVITTESGLQYKVITKGTGEIPADTCFVKVNYKGTLIDGTEFDSSYKRKDKNGKSQPATFRADRVIKGWTEALTMMPVGSKWELYIPYDLAYGSRASGPHIKPFSTLIFEVELVGIDKKK